MKNYTSFYDRVSPVCIIRHFFQSPWGDEFVTFSIPLEVTN